MSSLLQEICDSIWKDFGRPQNLLRLLENEPKLQTSIPQIPRTVNVEQIVQWDRWSIKESGHLQGWQNEAGNFSHTYQNVPELDTFCTCKSIMAECEIQEIVGLSSARSNLDDFSSLDELVETNSKSMIDELTFEKLNENLAHHKIRILHDPHTSDHFAKYLWDGRIFLQNTSGAHHLSAARYIASRINHEVKIKGKMYEYSIDPVAVNAITNKFDLFIIPVDAEVGNPFHEAMRSFQATYFQRGLPRPISDLNSIWLPKDNARSMRVSRALREAGVLDLGHHLLSLAKAQIANTQTRIKAPAYVPSRNRSIG